MRDSEAFIPILISLGFFAMVFGIVYMYKRENLAMIEKGINPKQFANRPMPYVNLKYGLLLLGAGVGLFAAYMIDQFMIAGRHHDSEAIYFALIAIGGGLGLIGSYRVEKKELLDKKNDSERGV